ncbi:MAG: PAS domain-containing hybrid sensor histidine kinase/response regulator [Gemmatimonadales bacterium]
MAPSRKDQRRFRRIAIATSAAVGLIGIAEIVSNLLGTTLPSLVPNALPMRLPAATSAFILSVCTLLFILASHRLWARITVISGAAAVAATAIVSLFAVTIVTPEGPLGILSVTRHLSATNLIMASVGVGLLPWARFRTVSALCGVAMATMAAGVGLALLYGGSLLDGVPPVTEYGVIAATLTGVALVAAAGPATWPIRTFVGPAVQPMLLRWIVPLIFVIVVGTDLLTNKLFARFSPAIGSVLNSVLSIALAATVVWYVGGILARRLDKLNQELRESEAKFRQLFTSAPAAISVTSRLDGRYLDVNTTLLQLMGYRREEVIGRTATELGIWGSDHDRAAMVTVLETDGEVLDYLMRLQLPGGKSVALRTSFTAVEIEREAFIISVAVDETERLKAEEARRKSEGLYRELVGGVRDVVFSLSPEMRITSLNPAFEQITGHTAADWLGRPFADLLHPGDVSRAAEELTVTLGGEMRDNPPLRIRTAQGGYRHGEIRTAPRFEDGHLVGIFGIGRDVSDRVRLESDLRQAQKMDALGTLAGGIAHDFNNILTAIGGNAQLAALEAPEGPVAEKVGEILKAQERARDLVRRILLFSRREESHKRVMSLGPLVDEVLELLRASLPSNVEIRLAAAPDLPLVSADATQMHQVLMNLGTNAGYAMRERGGILSVALDTAVVGDAGDAPAVGLSPGPYVRLTVRDTGSGMSREVRERLFEPFFSTKGQAGTGLGLSVVHGIIRDHTGAITVTSEPGEGTEFGIYLPARKGTAESVAPLAKILRGADEHLMYVDDEPALTLVMSRTLEHLGYRCTAFTDAAAALQEFRTAPRSFDAVITDLQMPTMSGLDLARSVRAIRADIPVAVASGYASAQDQGADAPQVTWIQKPTTLSELSTTLRQMLDRESKGR